MLDTLREKVMCIDFVINEKNILDEKSVWLANFSHQLVELTIKNITRDCNG